MAKRRKEKDEGENLDFKLPKFDEEKFLSRERTKIKTIFISFIFGIVLAMVCFGFWSLMSNENAFRWELVLLVAIFNATFLKPIFQRLNIDVSNFGKKEWFSVIAIYFFTWLLVFIVIVNPPFYDDETPRIEIVALPDMQEIGGTVKIVAKITDNMGIDNIDFTIVSPDGTSTSLSSTDYTYDEDNILVYEYSSPDNLTGESDTYTYTLSVTDVNKHTTEETGTFTYSANTIKLPEPTGTNVQPGPSVTYSTNIKFDVKADVSRFYYVIDDGEEINATKDGDYYTTSPKIKGWTKGANVSVKAYAEIIHYVQISALNYVPYSNTIVDSSIYYFNVSDVPEIGGEDQPTVTLPSPPYMPVPGFELVAFLVSLIAVVLIFKYKKKDKRN